MTLKDPKKRAKHDYEIYVRPKVEEIKSKKMPKKEKNLEPLCYGSSFPIKYVEFEMLQHGPRIKCKNQFKPNGIGVGKIRESSSDISYAGHCREIAKWFNKAAKIMEKRFEEKMKEK